MNSQLPSVGQVIRSPALLLATWWGSGLSPRAPGTVGSVAALPFCYLWLLTLPGWGVAGVAFVLLFLGVWAATQAGEAWGKVDHGAIVIDEVLGQLLALAIPFYVMSTSVISLELLLIGFVLFRLFDVSKPWPVSYFDNHWKSGWGVMMDDVAAGVLAGLGALLVLTLLA
jgi:phosphatidylglycerophosphatase A